MKNLAIIIVVIILVVAGFAYFNKADNTGTEDGTATTTDESVVVGTSTDNTAAVGAAVDTAAVSATATGAVAQ